MNRMNLYKFALRAGSFIQPLSMLVLKPGDLISLSRSFYSSSSAVEGYSDPSLLDSGLTHEEEALFDHIPVEKGRVLILGIGGGRDVIGIGQKGHEIYGVDYVPEMVMAALKNAAMRGIHFKGVVQEISQIGFCSCSFDIVFFSTAVYSSVPTKKRRKAMLERIHEILKPDGYLVCQFYWKGKGQFYPSTEVIKKITGFLTRGYTEYETGDFLRGNIEFLHAFHDKQMLLSEFYEAGFMPVKFTIFQNGFVGGALLKKLSRRKRIDHD